MDAETCRLFVQAVDEFYARFPQGNYYEDRLAAEFARSADPARAGHAGDWAIHFPVPGDPHNIAMFASGLGDGTYHAEWGIDGSGQASELFVDFGVADLDLDQAWLSP